MKSILSAVILFLLLLPSTLSAEELHSRATTLQFTANLLADRETIGSEKTIWMALDIDLSDGWHTYWKLPGETGAPPSIDWSGSTNLESAELLFPAPTRIKTTYSDVIGYEELVTFPIKVSLKEANTPLQAKAIITLLLCKRTCVPQLFELDIDLKVGDGKPSIDATLIKEALAKVPMANEEHGLKITRTKRTKDGFSLHVYSKTPLRNLDVFVHNPDEVLFKAPKTKYSLCRKGADITFELPETSDEAINMSTLPITITVVDGNRSIEEVVPNIDLQESQSSFSLMLLFAFLGGLILNLMPCVLPVLSLKIMAVLKQSGQLNGNIRKSFIATSSGIICSFMLLAVLTIGLKYTGYILGWGIQFQQPLFILFMTTLLTLFAANMWGFFHINLPHWTLDKITTKKNSRLAGDFGTGMFATLLATPCTAPFLGTAVGFALASGTKEILAIFFFLGVGMSFPFLLVALRPSIAKILPKPGAWMTVVSKVLGLGLAGTAAWLLFVLKAQVGFAITILVTFALFILVMLSYLRSRKILTRMAAPAAMLIIVGVFAFVGLSDKHEAKPPLPHYWKVFDQVMLNDSVRSGKVVFVDITADWCLNCRFNKEFILSQDEVRKRIFTDRNIIAMQGDWTNKDDVIKEFLQHHGRYGIPFNAVFGPSAPNGILLPEVLTPSTIFEALDKAR